jgi:hypothetical protein
MIIRNSDLPHARIAIVFPKVLQMLNQNIALVVGLITSLIPIVCTSSALANGTTDSIYSSSDEGTKSSLRLTSMTIVDGGIDIKSWCTGQDATNKSQPFGISKVVYYRAKEMKKGQYNLIGCVTNNSGKILRKTTGSYLFAYPDKRRPNGGHVNISSGSTYFNLERGDFQPNDVRAFGVKELTGGIQSTDLGFYTDDYAGMESPSPGFYTNDYPEPL